LLTERAEAGVDIRVIGKVTQAIPGVKVHKLAQMRLHTRSMVRDGQSAFVGSQSLRALELDARREMGLIFRQPKIVSTLRQTFTSDWTKAEQAAASVDESLPALKVAKKVAKLVAKELPPVIPALNGAVKQLVGDAAIQLDPREVEAVVKEAVKVAVKEAVSGMVEEVVDEGGGRA
jgi:phosphatidylserine/phosphatidylglycerophosphate/cardiolipin synthase-like enzyme